MNIELFFIALKKQSNVTFDIGQGKLLMGTDGSYEGSWSMGEMTGFGLRRWANGSSYSGEFLNGEASGEGVYIAVNGDKYEGPWRDNKRDGHNGELTLHNGDQYIGSFMKHMLHGPGTYKWADGAFHAGQWVCYDNSLFAVVSSTRLSLNRRMVNEMVWLKNEHQ
jgi:hypothetical protein